MTTRWAIVDALADVYGAWQERGKGFEIGATERLVLLVFADNLYMVARTLPRLRRMMREAAAAVKKRGWKFGADDAEVLLNRHCAETADAVTVEGIGSIRVKRGGIEEEAEDGEDGDGADADTDEGGNEEVDAGGTQGAEAGQDARAEEQR